MAEFILGIDAGGTAVKVAVISAAGEEVAVAAMTPRLIAPAPGHAERDAEAMWTGVAEAIPVALARAGIIATDIAVVGLTGFGNGLFLFDAAGRAVGNAVLAADIRAASIVDEWVADGLGDEQVARTHQRLWPGKPAAILAWLLRHRPEALADAAAAISCKDFLRLRLTGTCAAEVTDQSTGGLLGTRRDDYDRLLFQALGLSACEHLLAPLVETMTIAGTVTAAAAAATGLREGTPVSAGLADNHAVMYGTGVTDTDRVVVMSGTWGLHQSFLTGPVTDGSVVICAHGARPGEWIAVEGSPTSASSLEWFVETFLRATPVGGGPDEDLHALCNRLVAETPPDGPPVYFLPFLNGAIDCSSARGSLIGFSSWHRLGHAVRAIYEGVAFEHRRHLERLCRVRARPAAARFAGGAARSRPWSEIFAAGLGLALEVPAGSEFGARGAALIAAIAAGRLSGTAEIPAMTPLDRTIVPDGALAATLDRRYAHYLTLFSALAPHWKEVVQ